MDCLNSFNLDQSRHLDQLVGLLGTLSHLLPADVSLEEEENSDFDFKGFYPRVLRKSFKGIKPSQSLAEEQDRPFS